MFPNLDAEMARHRITQAALADEIKVNPGTLSLKLNGKSPFTLPECIRIRDVIDRSLTIEYLFHSED